MMKRILVFALAAILVLTVTSAVFAADIEPCTGNEVIGTVVGFDETTNTVVIAYDHEGTLVLCSVTFQENADYGHPVTTLLGNYFEEFFGSYDPDALEEAKAAFEATLVCVVEEEGTYVLSDADPCEGEGVFKANLLGSNDDGSFTLLFGDGTTGMLVIVEVPEVAETVCVVEDDNPNTTEVEYVLAEYDDTTCLGTEVEVTTDNGDGTYLITFDDDSTGTLVLPEYDTLAGLEEAAAGLVGFSSKLSADGVAWAVGDDIAQKHDEGFGFGVIVKLYALANSDPDLLQELFVKFDSGTGMGKLFKDYGGKPGLLGVGHVRQDNGGGPGASGLCNENAAPKSAAGCGTDTASEQFDKPTNSNSNKDKTKNNNGKNNKGN